MQLDCSVTIPYWAWDEDTEDPWNSLVWDSDTYGAGSSNQCLPNGPFRLPFTKPDGTCVRRTRNGGVPSPQQIALLLATDPSDFELFNGLLDAFHGGVHCSIGGTMCTTDSAAAPGKVTQSDLSS